MSDMPLLLVRSDWSFSTSVKSWFSHLYALENPVVKDVFCSSVMKCVDLCGSVALWSWIQGYFCLGDYYVV